VGSSLFPADLIRNEQWAALEKYYVDFVSPLQPILNKLPND
jgi:hypothetical protein